MPKKITKTVYTFKELIARAKKDPADRLRSKAVDQAREWLQRGEADDNDWHESTIEEWKEALQQIGFDNPDVNFSGFCSQGDGASFTADVDLAKLIEFMSVPREGSSAITSPDGVTEDFRAWLTKKCDGVAFDPKYAQIMRFVDKCEMKVVRTDRRYSHTYTCNLETDFRDQGDWSDTGVVKDGHPEKGYVSRHPKCRKLWESFVEGVEQLRQDLCGAIYKSLEGDYDYRMGDENLLTMAEANEYFFTAGGKFEG